MFKHLLSDFCHQTNSYAWQSVPPPVPLLITSLFEQIRCTHVSNNMTETRKHDRHLQCKMTGISGATWQSLSTFCLRRFSQLLPSFQWVHCFAGSFALPPKIEMLNFISQIWNDPHCQWCNHRWLSICCNSPDLMWTDIFSYCGYKQKIWKLLSLVR